MIPQRKWKRKTSININTIATMAKVLLKPDAVKAECDERLVSQRRPASLGCLILWECVSLEEILVTDFASHRHNQSLKVIFYVIIIKTKRNLRCVKVFYWMRYRWRTSRHTITINPWKLLFYVIIIKIKLKYVRMWFALEEITVTDFPSRRHTQSLKLIFVFVFTCYINCTILYYHN